MSQATHVYRNVRNDRLGEMTEAQAALWPDLLVRVDAEPVAQEPVKTGGDGARETTPARITKKKD